MDLQSGYPYSLIRHGLPCNYPWLEQDIRTDVAVIGGGISGALTAYALTQAGISTVVLDARTIGLGSTAASTSLLQYEIDTPLTELREKSGIAAANRAYELCADAISSLESICKKLHFPLFEKKKSLYLASYQKDVKMLEAEFKARQELGLKMEWWESAGIKEKMGFDAPAAIYSHTAAQTDAYMLTHALHQHNIQSGAQVFDRTAVVDMDFRPRSVVLKTSQGHQVSARHLVIATGYEVLQYIKAPLLKLNSTYAVVSEPNHAVEQWYQDCLIWETKSPYLYLRTTSDHRVLIGGRDEPFYNPAKRDKLIHQKAAALEKDLRKKFPALRFKPEFKWTGTFGSTEDGLPFIGAFAPMPHTYFALGFGGNGITFSQIAADIIADLVQGKKNPDATIFSFNRKIRN
ncbi:NAD(P)/FAD-dependent oxidoreductase [Chitinophaga arvensicola]|uniref:Glycine/D-amino acid oxidase n=1 Tax=Chitinophaga arvensicola TaxID=29529 RepID=A0A1I0R4Z7_9BACT|nr:FAD-binding oxidoreductase [Chitinophaga arvensicola]SEW35548.1 Glycine/D-amino acid oxidase [Chitinophaga arvensicola]